jgi:hypothetical protein
MVALVSVFGVATAALGVAKSPVNWTELNSSCQVSGNITLQSGPFDMAGFVDYYSSIAIVESQTVHIVGNGAVLDGQLEPSATNMAGFFRILNGSLTLESVTLKNGGNTASAGAIEVRGGALTVKSGTFLDNRAGVSTLS